MSSSERIIKDYPPNFNEINSCVHPPEDAIFTYGQDIYNPSGGEIPPDILFHERVHTKQQGQDPKNLWFKWCYDLNFRKEQETEAFALQWKFVKENIGNKAAKECLDELAEKMQKVYNLGISFYEAHTSIRKWNSS